MMTDFLSPLVGRMKSIANIANPSSLTIIILSASVKVTAISLKKLFLAWKIRANPSSH